MAIKLEESLTKLCMGTLPFNRGKWPFGLHRAVVANRHKNATD